MAAPVEESMVLTRKGSPQSLNSPQKLRIIKQLHPVNHDLKSSENLSLFWTFGCATAVSTVVFYPFLKPAMRFSGSAKSGFGMKAERIDTME